MPLIVTLLLMTLVTQCWSAPMRRNWTPQAILYLKGAQAHRSVLERTTREEGETLNSAAYNRVKDGLGSSLPSLILDLLQRAEEEGGENPDDNLEDQELNFNVF
ncbi:spexin prohormone 1-like [Halichoeres trimaculatus]|uniref:spexin prohormone 1-like n=1 Tax=Halichoeres trimaculatus TaxID=147232 RepID=UPI003D9DEADC